MSREFIIQTLIEFGPLTAFFFASFIYDFYTAASVLVASTLLALLTSLVRYRRFALFSFFSSVFVLVCGTATVYFHDPRWIVTEYTISNMAFACALLTGWVYDKPILQSLFGHMFLITHHGWMVLTFRWGLCFFVTALTNHIWWWYIPDEEMWSLFRFVSTFAVFIFGMLQFTVSRRERLPGASPWGLVVNKKS